MSNYTSTSGSFLPKPMMLKFGDEDYVVERAYHEFSSIESRDRLHVDAIRYLGEKIRTKKVHHSAKYAIEKIIYNGPATIVFWKDGEKTVVKLNPNDKNNREVALLYAIAKKKFGNNSRIHKEIDPFASTNAQRIAILKYIVAKDGVDIGKLMDEMVLSQ